jgi:ssRNA-specific RNase YbeY (16S rRNA maturation enzyme)
VLINGKKVADGEVVFVDKHFGKKQVRDWRNQTKAGDNLSFKAFIRNVLKKQSN